MKFLKKPIVVDAVRWTPDRKMCRYSTGPKGAFHYENRRIGYDKHGVEYTVCDVGIRTLEGFMHLRPGYWIVTGVKGEKYAVRPDIFRLTYEALK